MSDSTTSEMDTSVLFEKFTVEEVKEIEKKTRADIEKKKEDLRQMVGERYRDLIEAADTITEMKFSAENVQKSVSRMQELCTNLRKTPIRISQPDIPMKQEHRNDDNQLYSIASQIKVLIDIPERIWVCVDNNDFLCATRLYLLARHINTSLQMQTFQNGSHVAHYFPILNRQWSMISHFHATILKLCREKIAERTASDQLVTDCLCSIMLLEDSTPRQVFNELLLIRSNAIHTLVSPDHGSVSIKAQVCDLTAMIVTTVHQIYTIFYSNESNDQAITCNLLVKTYQNITNPKTEDNLLSDFGGSIAFKYLPTSVTEFVPRICNDFSQISTSSLSENTLQWLQSCIKSINSGLSKLLSFVTTVKALSDMKASVWDILDQDPRMKTWDTICMEVLGNTIPVWEECLQRLFLSRVKVLVKQQLEKAIDNSKQQIGAVVEELGNVENYSVNNDHDVSRYVWTESSQDILSNSAWISTGGRATNTGPLHMKAKAFTPTVQSLCRGFDQRLSLLLQDLQHYTDKTDDSSTTSAGGAVPSGGVAVGPFDQYSDCQELDKYLQNTTEQAIDGLLENLKKQLEEHRLMLKDSTELSRCKIILDKVLLLGRFTSALIDLSSNLQRCLMPTHKQENPHIKLSGKRSSLQSSHSLSDNKHLSTVKSALSGYTHDVYSFWCDITAQCLVCEFKERMIDKSSQAITRSTMSWDVIEIEEETEEGKSVNSNIKIPMQVSWYVQSLLYEICSELNRIGGHSLNRNVLDRLTNNLSTQLFTLYDDHLTTLIHSTPANVNKTDSQDYPFGQSRAIQLLFDVKFLNLIFPVSEKKDKKSYGHYTKCVDLLESKIDPFDLDVFSPYIQSNLHKHVQRSQVLYGFLGTLDRHSTFMGSKTLMGTHQDLHNVLPLVNSPHRFPLLPITTQTRPLSVHLPLLQSPKFSPGPLSPPIVNMDTESSSTSSFFESVSTIWFTKSK